MPDQKGKTSQKIGNISQAVSMVLHHVAPHKARMMARTSDEKTLLAERHNLIRGKMIAVQSTLNKIRKAAEIDDIEAVKRLLCEDLEFVETKDL